MVRGLMVVPPNQAGEVGQYVFRILDLGGKTLGDFPGRVETISSEGNFQRAVAHWPSDLAVPGAHHLLGIVLDKNGGELARTAPRMVSVSNSQGY